VSQVVAIEDEVGMRNGQLVWYGQRSFVSSDMKFKKEEGDGTKSTLSISPNFQLYFDSNSFRTEMNLPPGHQRVDK